MRLQLTVGVRVLQHEQGLATRGTVDGRACVLQEPPATSFTAKLKIRLMNPPAPLMPAVMAIAFCLLGLSDHSLSIAWTATFFWLWSVKNRILGPKALKQDMGVVSFLVVMLAFTFGYGWVRTCRCSPPPCSRCVALFLIYRMPHRVYDPNNTVHP